MPLRQQVVEDMAAMFAVLGHVTRVRILILLRAGEWDVSELSARLGLPATNVSQHLALLRSHGVAHVRRDGAHMRYSLRDPRTGDLISRALDILDTDTTRARDVHRAITKLRSEA